MSTRLNDRGFSLVDLLVATTLALVIGAGAVVFVRSQTLAMRTNAGQLDLNDAARGTVEFMAREIRMAGYNPRCLNPSPVSAIVTAQPQLLRMQYDLNENGVLDAGATASEDVTYQYDAGTETVQRVVGGQASELATDVPATGFGFRFYQSSGAELVGLGPGGALSGAQMAAVYLVSIRLEPVKAVDSRTTNDARSSLSTNVTLRNREYPCQ